MISSNHQALYISSREYGVGDVSEEASKKVPTAMATAKAMNKKEVSRVEKRNAAIFFCMSKNFVQKY